jgi:hypothetical protein
VPGVFGDLEARTLELPDRERARFRDDSEIQNALARIAEVSQQLMTGKESPGIGDLETAEALWSEVSDSWAKKLAQIELDAKLANPASSANAPCCGYCGADFAVTAEGVTASAASAASWARLRRHVQRIHPREWASAQTT